MYFDRIYEYISISINHKYITLIPKEENPVG